MKRLSLLFLCFLIFVGCGSGSSKNYENASFTLSVPEPFSPVDNAGILCFAPAGDPLLSSSVTVYSTELNWYFDSFTTDEYAAALSDLTGYESLTVSEMRSCKVDGCDARRIACKVTVDQGTHDLILYVVSADEIYVFTLLNRDTDNYVEAFDSMMKTVSFKGVK